MQNKLESAHQVSTMITKVFMSVTCEVHTLTKKHMIWDSSVNEEVIQRLWNIKAQEHYKDWRVKVKKAALDGKKTKGVTALSLSVLKDYWVNPKALQRLQVMSVNQKKGS